MTWKENTVFSYDLNLKLLFTRRLWTGVAEGWGLTTTESMLLVSDGSSFITKVDSSTGATLGKINVTDKGVAVKNLNELEFCPDDGLLYANIWFSNHIVAIDIETGFVVRRYDMSTLVKSNTKFA